MPLQDNHNLVAAKATLSPASLSKTHTHTHILLIRPESRCGNNGAALSTPSTGPVLNCEEMAVRSGENGGLKWFNRQRRRVV